MRAISPEDDVSSLGVGWDGTGDGGKTVGIEDGLLPPRKLCQAVLQLQVDVCRERREQRERKSSVWLKVNNS